jgi:starvation-inducible DNA-binding protein
MHHDDASPDRLEIMLCVTAFYFRGGPAGGLASLRTPHDDAMTTYSIAGLSEKDSSELVGLLQGRLSAYNDLHLTLKHVHWNVVGPNFIGVHEMIDPQVELVRGYADEVAERIATLGGSPKGTPGAIVEDRTWEDYSLGRDTVPAHLAALDLVYTGVLTDLRKAIERAGEIDPVTEDLLVSEAGELEQFQWFVRAHLENAGGHLVHEGATTETEAADSARDL